MSKVILDLDFLDIKCANCVYKCDNFCTLFNKGILANYRVQECVDAEVLFNMLNVKYSDLYRG